MHQQTILITGANGEVGHGLITRLHEDNVRIITLDLTELDERLQPFVEKTIVGDITDRQLLMQMEHDYQFDTVYHMAALLSTSAERNPALAHAVNVQGTVNLLELTHQQATEQERVIKFIFPSSVAVYGMATLQQKIDNPRVHEDQFTHPITMYGVTKLHCEQLGRYYSQHIGQLATSHTVGGIDFRGVRFPGLISATTLPSGGTSDYGPEMLHAAAQGRHYACFVRPDTTISFMTMPDAVQALLQLTAAPRDALTRSMYNITSFSVSAAEIETYTKQSFPQAQISYKPHHGRQRIVDSWPADLNDDVARRDWGWNPQYGVQAAFSNYLVPSINAFYGLPTHA